MHKFLILHIKSKVLILSKTHHCTKYKEDNKQNTRKMLTKMYKPNMKPLK